MPRRRARAAGMPDAVEQDLAAIARIEAVPAILRAVHESFTLTMPRGRAAGSG